MFTTSGIFSIFAFSFLLADSFVSLASRNKKKSLLNCQLILFHDLSFSLIKALLLFLFFLQMIFFSFFRLKTYKNKKKSGPLKYSTYLFCCGDFGFFFFKLSTWSEATMLHHINNTKTNQASQKIKFLKNDHCLECFYSVYYNKS